VVTKVLPGSPADTAGLKIGDRILKLDGRDVDRPRDLTRILEPLASGTKTKIQVERKTETITLSITPGKGL
jgi:serine protease Do